MIKFSVIIPAMNEARYLPKLLESIKQQTLAPAEIIVADAGSTDETKKIAESFGAKVVPGGLPGPGRNAGAAVATGDYFCFLDADIVLLGTDFFAKAFKEFTERGLDVATADMKLIVQGKFLEQFGHTVYNRYVRLLRGIHPHLIGAFIIVKRDLHKQINGFDPTVLFCEDHDYGLRAIKVGQLGYLDSVKLGVTDRRLRRDGALLVLVKMLIAELHIMFLGPIRHNLFHYEFGYKDQLSSKK